MMKTAGPNQTAILRSCARSARSMSLRAIGWRAPALGWGGAGFGPVQADCRTPLAVSAIHLAMLRPKPTPRKFRRRIYDRIPGRRRTLGRFVRRWIHSHQTVRSQPAALRRFGAKAGYR